MSLQDFLRLFVFKLVGQFVNLFFKMSDDDELAGNRNLTAVEAISARLAEVTRLAEKLDARLCEAGARTQIPVSSPANPATSGDSEVVVGIRKILENSGNSSTEKSEKLKQETAVVEAFGRSMQENMAEESTADGYVTATECPSTPIVQSRSASFVTSSECEDVAWWNVENPVSDVDNVEVPAVKNHEEPVKLTAERDVKSESVKTIQPKLELVRNDDVPEIDRTTASTVIKKTVEEKSGKIVKEVTETTTLRVSHSTHLGVTSYKLTSNTLKDNHEHTDVKELQDLRRFVENDSSSEKMSRSNESLEKPSMEIEHRVAVKLETERSPVLLKKEVSFDSDTSSEGSKEHSRLLKFTQGHGTNQEDLSQFKAISASPQQSYVSKETKESLMIEETKRHDVSFGSRHIDDSGIETTPKKNTKEEDDLLNKMKMVSRGIASENCEQNPTVNGLAGHCLTERSMRSACYDFMLGEIC